MYEIHDKSMDSVFVPQNYLYVTLVFTLQFKKCKIYYQNPVSQGDNFDISYYLTLEPPHLIYCFRCKFTYLVAWISQNQSEMVLFKLKNSVFIVNMAKNDQKSGQNGPKMASNGQSDSVIKIYTRNYIRKWSQMLILTKMLQNVLF